MSEGSFGTRRARLLECLACHEAVDRYCMVERMSLQNIRYVVPAVKNLRLKVSTNVFARCAPKLDYAKARQRWWIHVDFDSDIDLYIFEKALNGSEIRLVELRDTFYVEDPQIPDTAHIDEAHRLAATIIAQLNGTTRMLCPHFQGVHIESMVELFDNGTGRGSVGCDVTVHGTSDFPGITAFLTGPAVPINAILPALRSNKDVQEALFYLGAEGNDWANLYKVTEVVEDNVGGGKAVFEHSFCSRSTWDRFRRTANHQEVVGRFSRHARSQAKRPPDPMTVREARQFAGELVKKWIEWLTAEQTQEGSTKE